MSYIHPKTKRTVNGFNSHKEHCFYELTTKRQMFLALQSFAELLNNSDQEWTDKVTEEINTLKLNGIK